MKNVTPKRSGALRCARRSRVLNVTAGKGFTLVELMVVVAIISMLAALLLPAMSKAKSRSQALSCLSNLKQLQLSWQLYVDDNHGELPPNNYQEPQTRSRLALAEMNTSAATTWCPGNARTDTSFANIQASLLFPYNRSTGIYHCPADTSRVVEESGSELPQLRTRSYAMSGSMNCETAGNSVPSFKKFTDIVDPSPSRAFVFLDVHEDSLTDAHFAMVSDRPGVPQVWIELPADRHDQAGNLSFADGHVEQWRWVTPKRIKSVPQPASAATDLQDLKRLQSGMKRSPDSIDINF